MPYGHTTNTSSPCTNCSSCPDQRECVLRGDYTPKVRDAASAVWLSSQDELEPVAVIARDGVVGTEWF